MSSAVVALNPSRRLRKIIAFVNQKGGVGKTTHAYNLATELSDKGYSVLAVDLDPQASLTVYCGYRKPEALNENILNALRGQASLPCYPVENYENLRLAPTCAALYDWESPLSENDEDRSALSAAIELQSTRYDYVIIDTPPRLSYYTKLALKTCDLAVIPVALRVLDLHGLGSILNLIEKVSNTRKDVIQIGIWPNFYDKRKRSSVDGLRAIDKIKPARAIVYEPMKDTVAILEAPGANVSIADYAPRCPAVAVVRSVAKEVING